MVHAFTRFRDLRIGTMFHFDNAPREEIRRKISYGRFVDILNHGKPGNPEWRKKTYGGSRCHVLSLYDIQKIMETAQPNASAAEEIGKETSDSPTTLGIPEAL